jgi:polysaccharide transporter, PST family
VVSIYFGDNKIDPGHGRRSLRGGAASIVARAINALVQIGTVLLLARLLSPEDYGLVSMVTAITGFAPSLVDLGTRDAVVQRPRVTKGEVSALFWIAVALGCGSALAIAACSPLIAWFYGEPRLVMITVISALSFVTTALTCQHYALLRRAMKFEELSAIEVGANLFSAVASLILAFSGFHYWALALRPVAMTSLLAGGVWWRCRWSPTKPTMTTGVKEMLKFGLNSTGFTMTDFGGKSSDKIAIGYRSGVKALGYYQNAMAVYDILLELMVSPLHSVAVASLSKMRDDLRELRRLWGKALATLVFYAMPAFGILAVTSQDLIVLLLGAKWSDSGILLSVLALRGIPHTVERTLGWLHVAAGRTDRWMRWGVFAAGVHLLALFSGLPFGPPGVIVAYVVCMFILFIPAIAYAGRPLEIGAKDVIRVVWRPLAGSLVATAFGFLLHYMFLADAAASRRVAVLALAYVVVYAAVVVGLFRVRMPIVIALLLVRDFLPARFARLMGTQGFIDRYGHEQK